MTGCRSVSRVLPFVAAEDPMPAAASALSIAGADLFRCLDTRPARLLAVTLEHGSETSLIPGPYESENSDETDGLGHVIVRQFGCTRYTVEIELPLVDAASDEEPVLPDIRGSVAMVETLLIVPSDRFSLWSVADSLRLSANEPFVYGTSMELSEDESVLLRFDAKGSSARLMLVYKLEL